MKRRSLDFRLISGGEIVSASEEMTAQAEQMKNNINEQVFEGKGRESVFSQSEAEQEINHVSEISPEEGKFRWEMMIYRNFSYFLTYNYQ
ncbi:MAG: hypothetical protein JXA35_08650 [Deltaproteobacteria bacterium]|nr:hypothetical protein [Deltaproteobacteria bacterium]